MLFSRPVLPARLILRDSASTSCYQEIFKGIYKSSTTKLAQSCAVSTWSPFAAAFNAKSQSRLSFSFRNENKGLFGIPQLTNPNGFYLLKQNVEIEVDRLLTEATSPNRKRKIVTIFDELSDTLCQVADLADFVRVAHSNSHFASAAEETCVSLSSLVEKLNTDVQLHGALKKVLLEGDVVPTDAVDRRVTELFMFDFEQSGIHLETKKREQFVKLTENIHMLGTFFQRGSQKPIGIDKKQLPQNLRHVFALDGDNVMVTGLFSDHYSSMVREAAYRIFLHPDSHQEDLLQSLLTARHQLACLVGFDTYAHRANRGTMMEAPEKIQEFLQLLSQELKERVNSECSAMLELKKQQETNAQAIMPWDPPYLSALARQQQTTISQQDSMPYFSLGCVMEGLNKLFQSLFAVSLEHVQLEEGEAWAENIHKLAVVHATEGTLGFIYCDFFERSGKHNQDCHFTIRGGRLRENGTYQLPVVVLHFSLSAPRSSSVPSLLTLGQVDNLFHEFGHAMHSMLGRTRYQHVTGTRCSTDFAEVPSVLMEYFASDPRVISSVARHYKSGEPMKMSDVQTLCNAKKIYSASELQQQVFFSMLDQQYHGHHPLNGSTTDILAQVQNQYYHIEHVKDTAWQLRFSHLVGYGARYYAYLVSKAVAAQLWHSCFKADPFSREMGTRYREKMLAHGGGKPPANLVEDMLGSPPTVEGMVAAIVQELEENSKGPSR